MWCLKSEPITAEFYQKVEVLFQENLISVWLVESGTKLVFPSSEIYGSTPFWRQLLQTAAQIQLEADGVESISKMMTGINKYK